MDFIVFTTVTFCFMLASTTANKQNNNIISESYVIPLSDKYLQELNLKHVNTASKAIQKTNEDNSIWIAIVPDRMLAKKANGKEKLKNRYLKTNIHNIISDKRAEIVAEKNALKKLHKKFGAKGIARVLIDRCPIWDITGEHIPPDMLGRSCSGISPRNVDTNPDKEAVKHLVLSFDYGKANSTRYWLSKAVPPDSEVCLAAHDKEGHHIFGYHETEKVCKDGRWKGIPMARSDEVLGWAETERTKYHFLPTDKLKLPLRAVDISKPSFYKKLPFKVVGAEPLKINGKAIGWGKLEPPHWSADVVPADSEDCLPINDGEGNLVLGYSITDTACKDTRFSKTFDESDVHPEGRRGGGSGGNRKVIGWINVEHDHEDTIHPCYDDLGQPIKSDVFKSICDGTEHNVIVDHHKYHSEMLPYSDRHPLRHSLTVPEIFDHKLNDDNVVIVVV